METSVFSEVTFLSRKKNCNEAPIIIVDSASPILSPRHDKTFTRRSNIDKVSDPFNNDQFTDRDLIAYSGYSYYIYQFPGLLLLRPHL